MYPKSNKKEGGREGVAQETRSCGGGAADRSQSWVHLLQGQASKQEGTQKRHSDLSDLLPVPPQWSASARNQPARQLGNCRQWSHVLGFRAGWRVHSRSRCRKWRLTSMLSLFSLVMRTKISYVKHLVCSLLHSRTATNEAISSLVLFTTTVFIAVCALPFFHTKSP